MPKGDAEGSRRARCRGSKPPGLPIQLAELRGQSAGPPSSALAVAASTSRGKSLGVHSFSPVVVGTESVADGRLASSFSSSPELA